MVAQMHLYKNRQRSSYSGFTMLELMVIVAIVGILVAVALPSLRESVVRNARDSAVMNLMSSLALARSEAVTGSGWVSVCRSTNQTACAGTAGADWSAGWIVFTDTGVAGTVDGSDAIVQVRSGFDIPVKAIMADGNGANITSEFLRFDDDGFLDNVSTGAYFEFCGADNVVANARAIWISNTGRAAMSVNDSSDGVHNDLAGANLTCP